MLDKVSGWRLKTQQQILTELRAYTETYTDSTLYTYAGLSAFLGLQNSLALRSTLKAILASGSLDASSQALLDFAHARLEVGGLDFSLADVQASIESLRAVSALAAFIDPLKAIGVQVNHPYADVTLAQVQAEIAAVDLSETKQELMQAGANRWNAFVNALDAWDGSGSQPVL